jgi:hypothetical protein
MPDEMAKMGELIADMAQSGVLLATEGCLPSSHGFRVRLAGGQLTVTDGPFAETKELIAGFALIKVESKEEAIKWTRRFLETVGRGESEVRLLHEQAAFDGAPVPETTEAGARG